MSNNETEHAKEAVEDIDGGRHGPSLVQIVLAELAVVLLIAVGVVGLIRGASAADTGDGARSLATPTVNLADLPDATAEVYRYAADHASHFAELPCYCGCEQSLGHRDLEECFVNTAGDWDAHASGCAVCTAEAIAAREQLAAGIAISDVRQSIITRFGPPPAA